METLQRIHNRGSISTGYDVDNSVKFDKGNDSTTVEFFERNVSTTTNRYTATFSAWIKKTDISTAQYLFTFGNVDNDNGRTFARFQADQTLRIMGGNTTWLNTVRVFRDTSAWYHIVVAFDNTSGTADERVRLYVNGVEETAFSTRNNPSQNTIFGLNFGKQAIGYNTIDNNSGFNGYMCEVLIQDGIQSAPTVFGEFNDDGIWVPIDLADVSVGTNGSYLKFENAASMGAATTGVGYTVQNINQHDQTTDTCTNNFAILNPLFKYPGSQVISQGATLVTRTSGSGLNKTFYTTQGVTSGKWYIEAQLSGSHGMVGATTMTSMSSYAPDGTYTGTQSTDIGYYSYNGQYYIGASGTSWGAGNWNTTSYIVQIAIDMDNRKIYFGNNNTYQASGNPAGNSNGITLPDTSDGYMLAFSYDGSGVWKLNTGGYTTISISSAATDANGYGTFEYAPPSGYYALCTKNLAEYG